MPTRKDEIALAERLTRIEAGQNALSAQIASNHANLSLQLKPILKLEETVAEHDRDINRWKGVNALLAFIATLAMAFYGKLKFFHP